MKKTGLLYGLTHNYTGYPLVKEARDMVAAGKLGKIRKVVVEYPQGWLATRLEASGQKQAAWRTDPKTQRRRRLHRRHRHARGEPRRIHHRPANQRTRRGHHRPSSKAASSMTTATCSSASKAAPRACSTARRSRVGEENNLNIRVYGEKGGLEWHQNEPNTMLVKWLDQPMQVYRTANGYLGKTAARRRPHAARASRRATSKPSPTSTKTSPTPSAPASKNESSPRTIPRLDYPKIEDGVRGMAFIEAVVASSKKNAAWTKLNL